MTEHEFLTYCKNQISGPLMDEDIITMLTAWGSIKYTQGYQLGSEAQSSTADKDKYPDEE